jgi:hypothetical protein
VRVVMLLAILVVLVTLVLPLLRRPAVTAGRARRRPRPQELVKDPVCQTYIVRSRAVAGGGDDAPYFCSHECARRYAG